MNARALVFAIPMFTSQTVSCDPWESLMQRSVEKQVAMEVEHFLTSPLPFGFAVTSVWGERMHPIYGTLRNHNGVDLVGQGGDPFVSVYSGKVIDVGFSQSYGNYVRIEHSATTSTLYAHAESILVEKGDAVEKGQRLGTVGETGLATNPHLHFELVVWGDHYDPLLFVKPHHREVTAINDSTVISTSNDVQLVHQLGENVTTETVWSIASEIESTTQGLTINAIMSDIVTLNPQAFPTSDPSYRLADIPLVYPNYDAYISDADTLAITVDSNQTLWSVSMGVATEGANIYQVRKGIVDCNKKAFLNGDINRMRADLTIRIPPANYIIEVEKDIAKNWFLEHRLT